MEEIMYNKKKKSFNRKVSAFAVLVMVQLLGLLTFSETVLAANIGEQLSTMGQEVSNQAISLISDILQFAVGPILLAVSIVFLIIKLATSFVGNRKGEDIDIKGIIISGIGVVVAGLLIAFRIDAFIS